VPAAAAVLLAAAIWLVAPAPAAAAADDAPPLQLNFRPPAGAAAPPPANESRARDEFLAVLLYANARYWINANDWVEDWRYQLSWEDQKRKFLDLDGFRFDSNDYKTNSGHALAGGMYYTLGRINNLGVGDSLLLAALESVYWEAVVEWREVFSINDTLMTTFGALSIGEPWYQLARYLATRPEPAVRALSLIHPLLGVHSLLDPATTPTATEEQTLPGYGVLFSLGAGATDSHYRSDTGGLTTIALRSRLALAPGFTAPGAGGRQGWEVCSSTVSLSADFDDGDFRELDISSGAVFYGRIRRDVAADLRGSGSVVGLGSAFTLFRKAGVVLYDSGAVKVRKGFDLQLEEPRDFRDKYTIVHLFGPVYEGYWRGGALGVSWSVAAYPDFAMVNAYALNAYSAAHDIAGVKTKLLYYGYYDAYGASVKARVDAGVGPVTLGGAASLSYHESIDGLDSYQDELTADVHCTDTWLRFDVRAGVAIPGTPLLVEATARWSSRRGTVDDTVATGSDARYSLLLTCRL
jgi:hypothetical protein